jgi:hypothetical protein
VFLIRPHYLNFCALSRLMRSAPVERCLACEAVVSRGYRYARRFVMYALYCLC